MKQALCRFIYYKVLGWKAHVSIPDFDKCVFCAAPHTTNWDLFIGKLFISAIGRESGFMMKKEWFFFPLGILFRWMGGIPVRRDKHTSLEMHPSRKIPVCQRRHRTGHARNQALLQAVQRQTPRTVRLRRERIVNNE